MIYHLIAFVAGFFLDLAVGDPYFLPHPVRWIGRAINRWERKLLGDHLRMGEADEPPISSEEKRRRGRILVVVIVSGTMIMSLLVLVGGYLIHPILGTMVEAIMTYQVLAAKCLRVESMKVYQCLKENSVENARRAVSMIVGRDTELLDETGVAKAAIETVAENTSDGVIAPLLYTAIGGPVLGLTYKSVNTMDSMVGYKNERYLDFGRAAARLDDAVNFLPSRVSAYLMILSCVFLGRNFSMKNAWRIYGRDRLNHASPNSAQTESACAGALGIQLAGSASYFGKVVEKPTIGDALRPVEVEDIRRANRLMYATSFLAEGVAVLIMLLVIELLC